MPLGWNAENLTVTKRQTAWDIFLRQLKKEKPICIVETINVSSLNGGFYDRRNDYIKKKMNEFDLFINENYKYVGMYDFHKVYRLVEANNTLKN